MHERLDPSERLGCASVLVSAVATCFDSLLTGRVTFRSLGCRYGRTVNLLVIACDVVGPAYVLSHSSWPVDTMASLTGFHVVQERYGRFSAQNGVTVVRSKWG